MKKDLIFLIILALGVVFFTISIVVRKRQKLRLVFINLGILTGILPLLIYAAFYLFTFIKERPYIGKYEAAETRAGSVTLSLFENNSFELTSDSCSLGFAQGTWSWDPFEDRLTFESTSQNMGVVHASSTEMISFGGIPVCVYLIDSLPLHKTTVEVGEPREEFSY